VHTIRRIYVSFRLGSLEYMSCLLWKAYGRGQTEEETRPLGALRALSAPAGSE